MKEDADRQVVMIAIDTTFDMLDKIGLPVIQVEGVKDAILTRMKEAFTHKVEYLVKMSSQGTMYRSAHYVHVCLIRWAHKVQCLV